MLEKDGPMGFLYSNFVSTTLADTYRAFSDRREALGLPNPGTLDNISKETQHVFLTGMTFAGLKADFTKALSFSPLFQVSHAFAVGSQVLPPYNFSALYGTDRVSHGKWSGCAGLILAGFYARQRGQR